MIISLGYRLNFLIVMQFRHWATEHLKEYMIKGFTMDDERLKIWVSVITGKSHWIISEIFVCLKRLCMQQQVLQ